MKTSLFFNLLLILIILSGSSCKKDKQQHTIAEGTVLDASTQQPIPNALVQLLTSKRGMFSYGFSLGDSVRSDADGKYYFSFQADDDFSYYLQAFAKRHIDQGAPIGITNDKKNDTDLPLKPEAFLKLHIRNSIADINKSISINEFAYHQPTQFRGGSPDSKVILVVPGNSNNTIHWWIYLNGNGNPVNTNIYCPAHDTTTFNIEY